MLHKTVLVYVIFLWKWSKITFFTVYILLSVSYECANNLQQCSKQAGNRFLCVGVCRQKRACVNLKETYSVPRKLIEPGGLN